MVGATIVECVGTHAVARGTIHGGLWPPLDWIRHIIHQLCHHVAGALSIAPQGGGGGGRINDIVLPAFAEWCAVLHDTAMQGQWTVSCVRREGTFPLEPTGGGGAALWVLGRRPPPPLPPPGGLQPTVSC